MNEDSNCKILLFVYLILFLASGCTKTVIKGSEVVGKITRLYRDANQVRSDLMIEEQIKDSIEKDKTEFLYKNNLADFAYYDVKVMEGRVLLAGVAFDEKTKTFLTNKVMGNLKIRCLLDEISIKRRRNFSLTKIKDYFLEKSIYMKVAFRTKIKSLNYEVSVIDGIAYIIGIAEDQEEHKLLLNLISSIRGIKQVVTHVIMVNSDLKLKIKYI